MTQLSISRKSIDMIVMAEVTSPDYYERKLSRPTWPGGDSGVTIGVGYDLGYNEPKKIALDWGGKIKPDKLQLLIACSGKKSEEAKAICMSPLLQSVNISFQDAYSVFTSITLPRFAKMALGIYPGLDHLLPDAVGGIVSMVFNRGSSLDGDRRKEMRAIVPMVAAKDYKGIAEQIRSSKRLWENKGLDGLLDRRDAEAALVENSVRQYTNGEIVTISFS